MDHDFGAHLARRIKAQGLSLSEFGRRAGTSPAIVSRVIRGLRSPPPVHFERWADVLDLKGKERADFIEACWLAGASDFVRNLVAELRHKSSKR